MTREREIANQSESERERDRQCELVSWSRVPEHNNILDCGLLGSLLEVFRWVESPSLGLKVKLSELDKRKKFLRSPLKKSLVFLLLLLFWSIAVKFWLFPRILSYVLFHIFWKPTNLPFHSDLNYLTRKIIFARENEIYKIAVLVLHGLWFHP